MCLSILPAMCLADALDPTRMPHVAGRTDGRTALVTRRPFRAPHQLPLPGEGSRAPQGVRLLDERPACRRHVLEVLRQPLEDGVL
jgi:magnesium chelatase family protein